MKNIDHEFVAEEVKIDFALMLNRLLQEQNISRNCFAELTGKKISYISRVMGGNANLTIETMSELLATLNEELRITTENILKEEYYHVVSTAFKLNDRTNSKAKILENNSVSSNWANLNNILKLVNI